VPFEDWVNIKSLEVVSAPRDVGLFKSFIAEIKNLQELSLKVFKSINEDRNLSILAQVANRVPNLKSEGISLASLLQMGYFSNLKEVTIKLEGPFTPLHEGDPSPFPYAKKLTIVLSSEINFKDLHAFLRFLRVMPVLRELNIVMNPVTRLDDLTIEPLPKGIQTITHTCLNEEGDKRTTPHLFALYANAQNVTLKGCSVDYLEPIAQRAPNRKINWSFLRLQECKSKYSDHLTIPGRNIFPNLHVPSVSFERSCRTIYPDDLSKSVVDTINAGQSDQGPVQ
jgi:hypothetical protein